MFIGTVKKSENEGDSTVFKRTKKFDTNGTCPKSCLSLRAILPIEAGNSVVKKLTIVNLVDEF